MLRGGSLKLLIDEQIVYDQLFSKESSIWSLLLASGYLKVVGTEFVEETGQLYYELALTNKEVRIMFREMIHGWFSDYDSGKKPSVESEPERFYHGFVLGLMVELENRYLITSNRESGFGRYDVMLEPKNSQDDAIIIEFKVFDKGEESDLTETVHRALRQIEEERYVVSLEARGISKDRIRKYGFAFKGKEVLIGEC